jgi:hypothetical protein
MAQQTYSTGTFRNALVAFSPFTVVWIFFLCSDLLFPGGGMPMGGGGAAPAGGAAAGAPAAAAAKPAAAAAPPKEEKTHVSLRVARFTIFSETFPCVYETDLFLSIFPLLAGGH